MSQNYPILYSWFPWLNYEHAGDVQTMAWRCGHRNRPIAGWTLMNNFMKEAHILAVCSAGPNLYNNCYHGNEQPMKTSGAHLTYFLFYIDLLFITAISPQVNLFGRISQFLYNTDIFIFYIIHINIYVNLYIIVVVNKSSMSLLPAGQFHKKGW